MKFDRAYVNVYLDRIEENMRAMQRNLAPGVKMIGTVKADGYGHGAVFVAKTIDPYVCGYAVASADEALQLRRHGIKKPVLILGVTGEERYGELLCQEIRMTVFQKKRAVCLSETAIRMGVTARIHIAVDTGMSRIGLLPDPEAVRFIKEIAALPGIEIEGLFTHFARADEADKTAACEQLRRFRELVSMVKAEGLSIPLCHCANSAAIVDLKEAQMDAVRAGISIYGLYPSAEVQKAALRLQPAMELKSVITYIKEIGPGTAVSYGGTFVADKPTRVATVAIGYGDGYPRSLSGKGYALVCGKRAPILGRVCMDQLMVNVTGIPEAAEDMEVTLLGRDGGEEITMEELASLSGGFHYEIPCLIGKRVPRVYVSGGKRVGIMTCLDGEYQEEAAFDRLLTSATGT
ncbi:MAG: alanine racemase [Lachnospiraceae bacterium]|nr:alanine racemase [Lachnospiraceae bacterium]